MTMSDILRNEVSRLYAIVSFGTLIIGMVGLTTGMGMDVISPLVIIGALVIGYIDIYWLLGGDGAYD
ncbi:hypothetical protein SAMN04488063_1120 [Halopelagius inordinatus]|uniref:Uncharacterized protein n=1 Tax=Halopelagius inordinatus TaxID=553467 RepID=A0A1I2NBR4_9EURY|nr:hypothetical protein [Halopelagius inordinatus]SFG01023.1 hypothetical protein SAMN04488063_1120 [Halopelagius inordinatus]